MAIPALKDLRKLLRTLETPIAFENFARVLRREKSDRALIVMCASFVDTGLKAGIWLKMPNRDAALSLFEDHGPLHSLSAKIRVAEALGLYSAETRRNLDIVQTVRNAFAHSLLVASFATPEVATACDALTLPDELTSSPFFGSRAVKFDTDREKFVAVSVLSIEAIMFGAFGEGTRRLTEK